MGHFAFDGFNLDRLFGGTFIRGLSSSKGFKILIVTVSADDRLDWQPELNSIGLLQRTLIPFAENTARFCICCHEYIPAKYITILICFILNRVFLIELRSRCMTRKGSEPIEEQPSVHHRKDRLYFSCCCYLSTASNWKQLKKKCILLKHTDTLACRASRWLPFQVHAHGFAFEGLMSFPFEWGQLNGGIFAMLLPTTYCLCKILSLTICKPRCPWLQTTL